MNMSKRNRSRKSREWLEWCKRCHGMGRRVFGNDRLPNVDRPAYDFYIKEFIRNRLGKQSRKELTVEDWVEMYRWLRSLWEVRGKFGNMGVRRNWL